MKTRELEIDIFMGWFDIIISVIEIALISEIWFMFKVDQSSHIESTFLVL